MRLSRPRLDPLPEAEFDEEQRELVQRVEMDGRALNIYRTLVRHPKLLKRWGVFGGHILYRNSLPPRDRELLILRTGWLCRCEYEWGQHVLISRAAGLSDDEITRVQEGPDADGWSEGEAALLRAADELHADAFVSDATWQALSRRLDATQLLDLVFTVGQYYVVAMALNTLGIQREEGLPGFGG
jgi:alkylhydroperoxidase family enzyme